MPTKTYVSRKGESFQIIYDDIDQDTFAAHTWYVNKSGITGYVTTRIRRADGTQTALKFHRAILNPLPHMQVDHINGNGLDNRRENLRICTQGENRRNQKLNCMNTSGFKGVSWNKENSKWVAFIKFDNKMNYLGSFDDKVGAALAYDAAASRRFGEFARLNFNPSDTTLTSLEYPAAGPREEEAYSLLREIVTLAKNNQGYQRKLADLKALLPEAPQIKQVILDWFARQ